MLLTSGKFIAILEFINEAVNEETRKNKVHSFSGLYITLCKFADIDNKAGPSNAVTERFRS